MVLNDLFLGEYGEGLEFKVGPFFGIVDAIIALTYLLICILNVFLVALFLDVGDIVFEGSLFPLKAFDHFRHSF